MSNPVTFIPLGNLALAFIPVLVVLVALRRWSLGTGPVAWATTRMVVQLVAIGYVLTFIFAGDHPLVVLAVIAVMLGASSWIALRPLGRARRPLLGKAFFAIGAGGFVTLAIVLFGVLSPTPWFEPRVLIPIAGMIFSNAMNAVSLAAERFDAELEGGADYFAARGTALEAAMIPLVNAFLAVGLVSLPGMMTGQILSGIEPHLAVRYQIVVMCMTFGAAGIASVLYLAMLRPDDPRSAPAVP